MGGSACIGLSPKGSDLMGPGEMKDSFAYHGSTGQIRSYGKDWKSYGPHVAYNDVVGCGVIDHNCFFTKNGELLGAAFRDVPQELYPTVWFWDMGHAIEANFGSMPFLYELDWDKLRRL